MVLLLVHQHRDLANVLADMEHLRQARSEHTAKKRPLACLPKPTSAAPPAGWLATLPPGASGGQARKTLHAPPERRPSTYAPTRVAKNHVKKLVDKNRANDDDQHKNEGSSRRDRNKHSLHLCRACYVAGTGVTECVRVRVWVSLNVSTEVVVVHSMVSRLHTLSSRRNTSIFTDRSSSTASMTMSTPLSAA